MKLFTYWGLADLSLKKIKAAVKYLSDFERKDLCVRVVMEKDAPLEIYKEPCRLLHEAGIGVMIEPIDSFFMKSYKTPKIYTKRILKAIEAVDPYISIVEVGNEVNGDWVGGNAIGRVNAAIDAVKNLDGHYLTAITPIISRDDQRAWVDFFESHRVETTDLALFSYYPRDGSSKILDWNLQFEALGEIFPKSQLGFGEFGMEAEGKPPPLLSEEMALIKEFYTKKISHPRCIGGGGYWDALQAIGGPLGKTIKDAVCAS